MKKILKVDDIVINKKLLLRDSINKIFYNNHSSTKIESVYYTEDRLEYFKNKFMEDE